MHIITIIDDRFRMSYIDVCAATSIYCEQVYWSGAIKSEKSLYNWAFVRYFKIYCSENVLLIKSI